MPEDDKLEEEDREPFEHEMCVLILFYQEVVSNSEDRSKAFETQAMG